MKLPLFLLVAATALSSAISLLAAEPETPAPASLPAAPAPASRPKPPDAAPKMRRELASAVWRAFASLPEKERNELMKLQREDWEAYRKKVLALGEKLLAEEQSRRAVLAENLRRYLDPAVSEQEKNELKIRILEAIRADYVERLRENRRRLEEMKKRTAKMEQELDRRSAAMEQAVNARLNYMLKTGNTDLPPAPPHLPRHPGSRRDRMMHEPPPPPQQAQ